MTDQELKDLVASLAVQSKETDRKMQEAVRGIERTYQSIDKLETKTEGIKSRVDGISSSNGKFAEEYFYNSLVAKMEFAGIHFDDISNRFGKYSKKSGIKDQFDIVMQNGNSLAIIEVKYKADSEDVKDMVEKKVSNFRTLYPEYANYKIYLGLASMSFNDYVVKEAKNFGIGLLKAVGETVEFSTDWVRAY